MSFGSLVRKNLLSFYSLFVTDLAMDLGTANTLIHARGKGIVVNEPSVVALDAISKKPLYAGKEAKQVYGKTPKNIVAIRPMKDGVVADFDAVKMMISTFIKKAKARSILMKPRIIIGVPTGITQVEKKAVIESALETGARQVFLVEEPMAAAIGTKMPVHESLGNLIVDIGGGTTEVAIISMFATVYSESVRVAGDELDEAIVSYIKKKHGLEIGIFEAEKLKIRIGTVIELEKMLEMDVSGMDIASRKPKKMTVTSEMIREALSEPIKVIMETVRRSMENISPEMAADVCGRGIVLAGGGALIRGLGKRLQDELGLPVYRARDPLTAIVRGVGRILDDFETFRPVIIN